MSEYREVEERLYNRWGEKLTKPQLRTKIHFEDALRRLIDICMTCPPEEFPENVHRLFWSIPIAWRDDELYEDYEASLDEFEYTTPVTCCGVPVDSDAIPANVERVTETDWRQVFNAVLNCCNRRGLLIEQSKRELITV